MSKTPKRPRDMMQLAKMVGEIATGETANPDLAKPTVLQERAAKGGRARAASLTKKERVAIARKGATASAQKRAR